MYDMLNDKHENLKTTVSEAVKTASEVKQTVKDAEITAREAEEKAKEVQESLLAVDISDFEMVSEQTKPAMSVMSEVIERDTDKDTAAVQEIDFVPITPLKVEVIGGPFVEEQKSEEQNVLTDIKETRKPKAQKTDLSLVAPGRVGGQNNNDRILELHNAGKSNMAIAKELGLGIGEVKLVIDLSEGI